MSLAAGEKAPFAGILITTTALAKVVTDLERKVKVLEIKLEAAKQVEAAKLSAGTAGCIAKVETERAKLAACDGDRLRAKTIYEQALTKCNPPPQSYHYLSFIGGALLGGGICAGAVAAVRQ